MKLAVIAGVLWLFGIALALLFVAATLTTAWRSRDDRDEELAVDIGVTALSLGGLMVGTLGVAGLLGRWPISLTSLALALLCYGLKRSEGLWQLREAAAAWGRLARRSPAWWALLALAVPTAARGLSIPQLAWDGVTYHLTYPASWVKHGAIVRFEGGGTWEVYETFPKGVESIYYLVLLALHNDFLINLANLPMWLLMALGVRVAARRLGASPWEADFTALIAAASPGMLAYITPAYVEVPKVLALAAALAAACRALMGAQPRALIPMGVALGFGLSIKLTTLSWAGPALLVVLFSMRRAPAEGLRFGALAVLSSLAVAGVWYAHNAARCGGNPIYPAPLPLASDGPLAGSVAAAWSLRETSVLSQAAWDQVLEYLAIPPWRARYPLGPGWGVLLAFPLGLLAPLLAATRQTRWRAGWLAALSFMLMVIYLVTPWNGVYAKADTRFLAPVYTVSVLACAAAFAGRPWWLRASVAALGLVASLGYLPGIPAFHDPGRSVAAWGVAVLATGGLLVARRRRRAALTLGLAALALCPAAQAARERHRFDGGFDLHPLPPASTALWDEVARLPPGVVAFAAGGVDATEAWFFYPLHGPDLRHTVTYVDIQADGDLRACQRRGVIRSHPDERAWLTRMRSAGVDYLVTTHDPPEAAWAARHPDRFTELAHEGGMRLFQAR